MQTELPWFDSDKEATKHAIQHSGMKLKQVAAKLYPQLSMDSAYARLTSSLNPDKPDKLSADEHIFIANLCDRFDFLYYTACQCHHSKPEPVQAADEIENLNREILANQQVIMKALAKRESLRANMVTGAQKNV